jgi:hypothetical protein
LNFGTDYAVLEVAERWIWRVTQQVAANFIIDGIGHSIDPHLNFRMSITGNAERFLFFYP